MIKINSPKGTPDEDVIFVLEVPTTERIKMRKVDVERELAEKQDDVDKKTARIAELEAIKADMEDALIDFKKK